MADILTLAPDEPVRLDRDRLSGLYLDLGRTAAEDVICRAVEELAARLGQCESHWRGADWPALGKCARSLVAISDQLGMALLARVAGDLATAATAEDGPAADAVLFRLVRVGDRSLTAVWDLRDLSV
ncbi:hypothetical protein [Pukyongiella litopenaei]|uniref:hypothetical protein n=1 Tax=Pukyongiella litopenaei TaxID=2605946 RepID=UPI001FCE804B|nr:hypothetical protein [Pukyongiella litopenaei]